MHQSTMPPMCASSAIAARQKASVAARMDRSMRRGAPPAVTRPSAIASVAAWVQALARRAAAHLSFAAPPPARPCRTHMPCCRGSCRRSGHGARQARRPPLAGWQGRSSLRWRPARTIRTRCTWKAVRVLANALLPAAFPAGRAAEPATDHVFCRLFARRGRSTQTARQFRQRLALPCRSASYLPASLLWWMARRV